MREAVVAIDQRHRFEDVYREHGARLLRSVLLFAGDREVADDAVAEAFAQAIRRGEGLRDALPWITRVAFRIAAGELKERRWTAYPLVERSCEMPEPAAELVGALAKLSPKQRAAAVLHFRRLRPRRGRRHHRLDGGGRRRPSEPSPQTAPRPPR